MENLQQEQKVLNFTTTAAKKVAELLKSNGKENSGIRISVQPGGCSGFTYEMNFENKQGDNDTVVEVDGIKFFVDSESAEFLKGTTVDFTDSLQGSGFTFSNPNATSSCGCGKSFC